MIKKLTFYAGGKKALIPVSLLFAALSAFSLYVPLYAVLRVLQKIMLGKETASFAFYGWLAAIGGVLYVLLYFAALMMSHLAAFRIEINLKKEGIERLLDAGFSFFDHQDSGKVRKIIDDNASETHTLMAHWLPDAACTLASVLPVLALMIWISPVFSLVSLIPIVASIVAMSRMMASPEAMKLYMDALENMNREAVEYVRGMSVVKIFRASVFSFRKFHDAIRLYAKWALQYTYMAKRPYVLAQVAINAFVLFFLPIGVLFFTSVKNPMLFLLQLIFFLLLTSQVQMILSRLVYTMQLMMRASEALERLDKLFRGANEKTVPSGEENFRKGDIEFSSVTFSYDGEKKVLENLNLRIPEGKRYALIGSSGGGKSTLGKLLAGFYAPDEGEIRIGGVPLSRLKEEEREKNISFVFQNARLFKKTIFENVRLAKKDASREEVLQSLSLARCDEILDRFEERENTMVGSRGVWLSGGEVQRIAVARAILKDAPILVLDEATASTDPENEYEMLQAFLPLMKGKTVLMIAHRLSSIQGFDRIVLMGNGKIQEEGTHEELMEKGGAYRKLYESYQSAHTWKGGEE